MTCAAVVHNRCIYLECKGPKRCLRDAGGLVPDWKPMRLPSKGPTPKREGKHGKTQVAKGERGVLSKAAQPAPEGRGAAVTGKGDGAGKQPSSRQKKDRR